MDRRRAAVVGVGALLALGAAACGEPRTDRDASDADRSVEIDPESGTVRLPGDRNGSYRAGDDGTVEITGEDGSVRYQVGDDTELPEGWPPDLAPPGDARLRSSSASTGAAGRILSVTAEVDGDARAVATALTDQLARAGYTLSDERFDQAADSAFGSVSATRAGASVVGTVSRAGDGPVTVSIAVTLTD